MKKLWKKLYHIFTISNMGFLLGLAAIFLGIFSAQNIKNELIENRIHMISQLKETRIHMISELKENRIHMDTVIERSDLLTKIFNIESYLDNSLIYRAGKLKLIEKGNDYKITESGKSTLSDLRVFDYLENIYYDQPDITTEDLIIHILSENYLTKSVWYFNEEREKRKELRLPLEAILATIIVHHESRHGKTQ